MQGEVLKSAENLKRLCIDFIKDFTYLLHFYFPEKANVMRMVRAKIRLSIFIG